jgi:hypothetical protein
MNSGIRMLASVAVGFGLLIAAPDGARAQDEPQGGCREAGQFIATSARELGRGFGEFSSELARSELGNLRDDFAQGLHSTLCAPQA